MDNKRIKVSIIVPIYNVKNFLPKCIESIIKQTHKNLEILLVDDGSKDGSGEIADNYATKDKRIIVIHQINSGVSSARNTGLSKVTGEYVCFADGDDYLMEDYVEYLLDMAIKYNADIALTTKMFSNYSLKQIKNNKINIFTAEEATESILCYNIPIGVYCKIFNRNFFGDKLEFITSLYIGEGFNFNVTAFQQSKIIAVGNRKIYYYRRDNPTSATTIFSEDKWLNGLMAIDMIKNNFVINTPRIRRAWKFAEWRTNSDIYDIMILSLANKIYPKMFKKCLSITRKQALFSLIVPTSNKQRIRAIIMLIYPKFIPKMMVWRRKKYNVDL